MWRWIQSDLYCKVLGMWTNTEIDCKVAMTTEILELSYLIPRVADADVFLFLTSHHTWMAAVWDPPWGAWEMPQWVKHLFCKHEDQSSDPNTQEWWGHACNPRARARTQGITGHTVWSTWWASNLERETVKKKRLIRKTFQNQPLVSWIQTYDLEHSLISSQHTHVNIHPHIPQKNTYIHIDTKRYSKYKEEWVVSRKILKVWQFWIFCSTEYL